MHFTMDRGSNILKAVMETAGITSVPCFSHVIQRAITETFEAVSGGAPTKKVCKISALF